MSTDDGPLLERAKQGDRAAFGALVKKHQKRVYATALHLTAHPGDADDVAQEAWIRAYRALSGFDGRADFFTWLYRIVVNTALNHLRAKKRAPAAMGTDLEPAPGGPGSGNAPADPRATAEARQQIQLVLEALAEMSPSLRVTLVLATIEEMPYHQISETLGVPEGTVAWRVNQARKILRHKLQALAPGATEGTADEVLRRTKAALGAR